MFLSEVPELSRFFGVVIKVYPEDKGEPHFHAIYDDDTVSVSIESLTVLDGQVPQRALRQILEWANQHQVELFANWQRVHRGDPITKIVGLSAPPVTSL
jgi:hypothetical protein